MRACLVSLNREYPTIITTLKRALSLLHPTQTAEKSGKKNIFLFNLLNQTPVTVTHKVCLLILRLTSALEEHMSCSIRTTVSDTPVWSG